MEVHNTGGKIYLKNEYHFSSKGLVIFRVWFLESWGCRAFFGLWRLYL